MRSEKEVWMNERDSPYQYEDNHNYDRKLKINLKQTTTVCRMQNQGWNDSVLKEISLYVPLGGAGTGSMLVFFW